MFCVEASAQTFNQDDNLHALVEASEVDPALAGVACVLIDEAQFLTRLQVEQLAQVSDDLEIPVLWSRSKINHPPALVLDLATCV